MSFGKWHEQQKAAEENGGAASTSSWFGDTEHLLPLYEGMQGLQPVSFDSIRSSMEAQMPKKIMGMGYQQRFKVCFVLCVFVYKGNNFDDFLGFHLRW